MKKAIVYIFTGTGNTMIAAEMISRELETLGYRADIHRIKWPESDVPDVREYDLVGLGYPVHAYNAPQLVCEFVKRLPETEKKIPAFVFKTSGEPFPMNNTSSMMVIRVLRKKGYDVLSETHMLMPYNIMFRYPDDIAKHMVMHTMQMSRMAARKAAAGERERMTFRLFEQLFSLIMRIEWFGAHVNGRLMSANETCIGCGKCMTICPAGNIAMRDRRPHFSNKCAMCMGCVMSCPKDSIRAGILTPWKLNGNYDFRRLLEDRSLPESCINDDTAGYFHLFCTYYERENNALRKYGLAVPGEETDLLLTNEMLCGIIQKINI